MEFDKTREEFKWPQDRKKIIEYYKKTKEVGNIIKMEDILPCSINKDYISAAEKILNEELYGIPPYGVFKYENFIDWCKNPTKITSYMRALHGHFFITDLVLAYKKTKDIRYIEKSYSIIEDWIRKNPYDNPKHKLAWHDETTAKRLKIWILFFDEARKILQDYKIGFILDNIKFHADLLSTSEFYSKNTNHGMFQDEAVIMYGDYFNVLYGSEKIKLNACFRFKEYIEFIYCKEGVHLEHSPAYHYLMAKELKKFGDYFISTNDPLGDLLLNVYNKAVKYGTYIVKPDGYLPQLGDTEQIKPSRSLWEGNTDYQYAIYKGKRGTKPPETDVVFKDAGYAIFRDDWGKGEKGTYVLFNAAYHTSYHKHSDDLNLWIYSNGDIIRESGPYGYNYLEDEFTEYAYSAFAHNGLIIDNKGLPRVDGKYNFIKIIDYDIKPEVSKVIGLNERYKDIKHLRSVEYFKTIQKIEVKDYIKGGNEHEFKLLWMLAPDINPVIKDNDILLFRKDIFIAEIKIKSNRLISVEKVKGQIKPFILGWYCKKFYCKAPTNVLVVNFKGKDAWVSTNFYIKN